MAMRLIAMAMLICSFIGAGPSYAQTVFQPAAKVNDEVITNYDVVQRARLLVAGGAKATEDITRAALEELIKDKLKLQVAKRLQIVVGAAEIDGAFAEFASKSGMSLEEFEADLASKGIDRSAMVDLISAQIVWSQIVNARFSARATPADIELDHEIELARTDRSVEYRLREIIIPATQENESEISAYLQNVRNEVLSGADFGTVAKEISRGPSAPRGGDIGWIPPRALPPEFTQILDQMQPGNVTPPLPMQGGLVLLQLNDKRERVPEWVRDVRVDFIRVITSVGEDGAEAAVAEAADLAEATTGCGGIPSLGDNSTTEQLSDVVEAELPSAVADAVAKLSTGGTSAVVEGDDSADYYVLCARRGGVTPQMRDQMAERMRTERMNRMAEGLLQELQRDALIEFK
jgi:peptidyl-prolyl cis-trans isomerase SurA